MKTGIDLGISREVRLDVIVASFLEARERGDAIDVEQWLSDHAEFAGELREFLRDWDGVSVLVRNEWLGAALLSPSPDSTVPLAALGDFRIVREVGRGGMGVVYEAEQLSLGRKVALKILPAWALLDSRRLQRFQNEARAAARLDHPHIVPVYAVGCENGTHFFAMRFIEGRSLREVIDELRRRDANPTKIHVNEGEAAETDTLGQHDQATLPALSAGARSSDAPRQRFFRAAAELGAVAAEALEHAHQCGVLHRDIKPANLLLDNQGHLWISDFGLASMQGAESLTETGELLGTLHYMSPEQAASDRRPVDARTDVYSLGMTLYELVTLRPAFVGNDRRTLLRQVLNEEPTPAGRFQPKLPRDLETIIMTAIAKDATDRYATAEALAADLRSFLAEEPLTARRPSLAVRTARCVRRHPSIVYGALIGLLACATLLFAVSWQLARSWQRAGARADAAPWDDAPLQLDEGNSHAIDAMRIAGEDAAAAAEVEIDWGDGDSRNVPISVIANHVYADGPAEHRLQVKFLDAMEKVLGQRSRIVQVRNVPPLVEARGEGVVYVGQLCQIKVGRPQDAGRDIVERCLVDWGDEAIGPINPPDKALHTYKASRQAVFRVLIIDEDGTFEAAALLISVEPLPPPQIAAQEWRLARTIEFDNGVGAFIHPQDRQIYAVRRFRDDFEGKASQVDRLGLFRIDDVGNAERISNQISVKCAAPHPISGDIFVHRVERDNLLLLHSTWQDVKWTRTLRNGDTDITTLALVPADFKGQVVKPLTVLAVDRGVGNPKELFGFSAQEPRTDQHVIHKDQGVLADPVDAAASRTEIYVADTSGGGTDTGRVFRVLPEGELEQVPIKGSIGRPCAIAVTADNSRMFLADMQGDRILEVRWPELEVREIIAGLAISHDKKYPYLVAGGLRLSPDERTLVVTDRGSGAIHLFERL